MKINHLVYFSLGVYKSKRSQKKPEKPFLFVYSILWRWHYLSWRTNQHDYPHHIISLSGTVFFSFAPFFSLRLRLFCRILFFSFPLTHTKRETKLYTKPSNYATLCRYTFLFYSKKRKYERICSKYVENFTAKITTNISLLFICTRYIHTLWIVQKKLYYICIHL